MADKTDAVSNVTSTSSAAEFSDSEHVTIWNRTEKRKIAGNAAPLGRNLAKYLEKHPDCEVYRDQNESNLKSRKRRRSPNAASQGNTEELECNVHVSIWHVKDQRKIAGNAAPLAKNLTVYLATHLDTEVYDGQDLRLEKQARRSDGAAAKKREGPRSVEDEAASFPLDPWLTVAEVSEETHSEDDGLLAISNIDSASWDEQSFGSEDHLFDAQISSCDTTLQPPEAPGFGEPVYY